MSKKGGENDCLWGGFAFKDNIEYKPQRRKDTKEHKE
jgi:hypothetical protein